LDGSDASPQKVISDLHGLLGRAQEQVPPSTGDGLSEDRDQSHAIASPGDANADDQLSLDDAENPLQLLARASDLQLSPARVHDVQPRPVSLSQSSTAPDEPRQLDGQDAKSFFVPVRASRDIGPDVDPIEMGIITLLEAESLFSLYVALKPHVGWNSTPIV
jgi:hypothetical protein